MKPIKMLSILLLLMISVGVYSCTKDAPPIKYDNLKVEKVTGQPSILAVKLANPADANNVFWIVEPVTDTGLAPAWVSAPIDIQVTHGGYVITNTLRYNHDYLYSTRILQSDYDAGQKTSTTSRPAALLMANTNWGYYPFIECWEIKQPYDMPIKTIFDAIDSGTLPAIAIQRQC